MNYLNIVIQVKYSYTYTKFYDNIKSIYYKINLFFPFLILILEKKLWNDFILN